MAGGLVMVAPRARGVAILPVDSEHNAIFQCLDGRDRADVRALDPDRLGRAVPRLRRRAARARHARPRRCAIPTWKMGPKITIDSATLMNKGLEVIEARWLFGVAADADRGRRPPAVDRPLDGRVRATAR